MRLLHDRVRELALELPGSVQAWPFDADTETITVAGRMFCLLGDLRGEPIVNLKAAPSDVVLLQETFPFITPGWHMNKVHWVSLHEHADLVQELLEDLVLESYLLVVEKLPRSQRPVDPAQYGTRD